MPAASGTRTQRAIRLELFLLCPAALLEPASQVRQQPFEFRGAWGRAGRSRRLSRPEQDDLARLAGETGERHAEVDAEITRQRRQRFAHQFAVAARPWRDGTV